MQQAIFIPGCSGKVKQTLYIPMDKLHFSQVGKSAGDVHGHWGQLVGSNILSLKMDPRHYNWTNKTSHVHLNFLYRQEKQPQTSVFITIVNSRLGERLLSQLEFHFYFLELPERSSRMLLVTRGNLFLTTCHMYCDYISSAPVTSDWTISNNRKFIRNLTVAEIKDRKKDRFINELCRIFSHFSNVSRNFPGSNSVKINESTSLQSWLANWRLANKKFFRSPEKNSRKSKLRRQDTNLEREHYWK